MKRIPLTMLGSLALGTCLSGCSTLYKVDVYAESRVDGDTVGNYVIIPADADYQLGTPEFENLASLLDAALAQHGYERQPQDKWQDAELAIYVSSDISEPGLAYRQTMSPVYEAPVTDGVPARAAARSSGQTSTSTPPPPPPPPQDDILVGYEKIGFSHEIYAKSLRVVAVDLQQYLGDIAAEGTTAAKPTVIWSVDVESTGSPNDMQEVLPVLIAAGQPYFGKSVNDVVRVRLADNDRRVKALSAAAQ